MSLDKTAELIAQLDALHTRVGRVEEAIAGIGHNGGPPLDPEPPPSKDRLLPTLAVAKRYGVTSRTIIRWRDDPALSFPQPEKINLRLYWRELRLSAWDRMRLLESVREQGGAAARAAPK
jgi:hypothetical protein